MLFPGPWKGKITWKSFGCSEDHLSLICLPRRPQGPAASDGALSTFPRGPQDGRLARCFEDDRKHVQTGRNTSACDRATKERSARQRMPSSAWVLSGRSTRPLINRGGRPWEGRFGPGNLAGTVPPGRGDPAQPQALEASNSFGQMRAPSPPRNLDCPLAPSVRIQRPGSSGAMGPSDRGPENFHSPGRGPSQPYADGQRNESSPALATTHPGGAPPPKFKIVRVKQPAKA